MKICVIASLFPILIAIGQGSNLGQVSGTVRDSSSAPIARVLVTMISLHRAFQTESASNGFFSFENVVWGDYQLEITSPGFVKKIIRLTIGEHNLLQTIPVVLAIGNLPDMERCGRNVSVKYKAIDSTGIRLMGILLDYFKHTPIENAEIKVISEAKRQKPVIARSDRTGHFTVTHLSPDWYNIQISQGSYHREQLRHIAVPEENTAVVDSTLTELDQLIVCQ